MNRRASARTPQFATRGRSIHDIRRPGRAGTPIRLRVLKGIRYDPRGEALTERVTVRASSIALAILATITPLAAAQTPLGDERSRSAVGPGYAEVARSVVRIQTIAQIDKPITDPLTGLPSTRRSPVVAYGNGIVIDTAYVDGQLEYLILTNYHVTNLNLILDDFARKLEERNVRPTRYHAVESKTYVVFGSDPDRRAHRIRTLEIVHDETADMAILRTVGADWALAVFPHEIGFGPGELEPGARVITSGFRMTGPERTIAGRIIGVESHALGVPHADYSVDLPLEPGQSGSPVFVELPPVPGDPDHSRFALVGLLHAREGRVHLMVPYSLWRQTFCRTPTGQRRSRQCRS